MLLDVRYKKTFLLKTYIAFESFSTATIYMTLPLSLFHSNHLYDIAFESFSTATIYMTLPLSLFPQQPSI
jgi:hypothetical protein